MGRKVKEVKRNLRGGHQTLESVRRQLRQAGNRRASSTVLSVQKSLSDQQLNLDHVLRRLAVHKDKNEELKKKLKAQKKEQRAKLKALRARFRRGG